MTAASSETTIGHPNRDQAPDNCVANGVEVRSCARHDVAAPQREHRARTRAREALVGSLAQTHNAAQCGVVAEQPLHVAEHAATDAEEAHGDRG